MPTAVATGNYGLFVVFPHPCGRPRGQSKNEAQSNADLASRKAARMCIATQQRALFRPFIHGANYIAQGGQRTRRDPGSGGVLMFIGLGCRGPNPRGEQEERRGRRRQTRYSAMAARMERSLSGAGSE